MGNDWYVGIKEEFVLYLLFCCLNVIWIFLELLFVYFFIVGKMIWEIFGLGSFSVIEMILFC